MNIIEGIQQECNRCRDLIKVYDELPNGVGVFAKTFIALDIIEGEAAIASGDAVRMITAYNTLKGCE